jgi:hypothetical protein
MAGGGRVRAAAVLATILAVVAAACDVLDPSPSGPPGGSPVDLRAEGAGFILAVRLPSLTLESLDAIPLETTLTWTGPAATSTVWGSGGGVVTFLYAEVGGAARAMGSVMTADCTPHVFSRNVPVAVPPGKGWGADSSDPNLAFYRAWGSDPVLHLPPGVWRIIVGTDGMLAPCAANAPTLKLSIPIELTVR